MLPHFLHGEINNANPDSAAWHVIPAPFEQSVSFSGGTASGPAAIIETSEQLETFYVEIGEPCRKGIHTQALIPVEGGAKVVLDRIANAVVAARKAGAKPILLGGEHTVTYGAILGLLQTETEPFGVIQFDAHADLRFAYHDNPYSHASVMRRVDEHDIPIYQIGVRALCREEYDHRENRPTIHYLDAGDCVGVNAITLPDDFPRRIYITFDIDGLDAPLVPTTGTPVPGGLGYRQALSMIESVLADRELIGADLVEHVCRAGHHAVDYLAAELTYRLMR